MPVELRENSERLRTNGNIRAINSPLFNYKTEVDKIPKRGNKKGVKGKQKGRNEEIKRAYYLVV